MMLNENQLDALTEVINIGVGRAASSLSEITGSPIELIVPQIHVCGTHEFSDIAETLDIELATTVQQNFQGDLSGRALLAFSKENAFELACVVGDIQPADSEMDEELFGILEEIGNIVLNAILGSIANILDCQFSYSLPSLSTQNTFTTIALKSAGDDQKKESLALIANTSFTVASQNLSGSLLVLFETGDIEFMLSALTEEAMV
jgi:chemotaxis protein CheC